MFLKPPRRAQLILCVGIVVGLAVSLLLLRTAHTAPASLRLSALAATPRTRHLSRGALCHGGAPVLPPDALQQEDEEALLSALSSVQRARTQPPSDALPHVLILTPVKNAAKHLPRYFANLASLDYPAASISLGIMDSDSADSVDPADEAAVRALTKTDAEVAQLLHGGSSKSGTWMRLLRELPALRERYRSVTLFQHDYGMRLAREDRHTPSVQLARRIIMAKSRNQLLQLSLCDEEWVLWLDSDLISFPPDSLKRLLAAKQAIVVANCVMTPGGRSYDLNSWRSPKSDLGNDAKLEDVRNFFDKLHADFIAQGHPHALQIEGQGGEPNLYLHKLRTNSSEIVRLDAVGGTMLLVSADLHRAGLIFPPFIYRHRIETEGLSMMALDMGVLSWGLPGLEVLHK